MSDERSAPKGFEFHADVASGSPGVPFYTFPPPDEVWTLKSELKLLLDEPGSGSLRQTSRAPPLPRRHEGVHRELSLESFPDLRAVSSAESFYDSDFRRI